MTGQLNDLSGPMRRTSVIQGAGLGLILGSFAAISGDGQLLFAVLLFGGLLVSTAATIGQAVWLRRADRAFRHELEVGAAELAGGTVSGERAVGRVVRRRIARTSPSWSTAGPHPVPGPSVVLVVTALTEAGARRVGVLVPATIGLESRRAPVVVRVHPVLTETALLDVEVSAAELEATRVDPRWDTLPLPTDSVVAGGYLRLAGVAAIGFALALVVAVLLVVVVG